jgi:Secretion system C-terminal sorting domain
MKNTLLPLRYLALFSGLVFSNLVLAQSVDNLSAAQFPNSSKDLPDKGVPLALNSLTIAAKTYTHIGKITSAGKVEENTSVTFKSAYAIELKPGFVAEKGSIFEASISLPEVAGGVKNLPNKKDNNTQMQNISHRLFPNPSSDNFTLEIQADSEGKADILVFNALGGLQLSKLFILNKGFQQISINCNNWAAGLYMVSIKINDTVKTERLVISKN